MTVELPNDGTFVGRVWSPKAKGPSVVVRRGEALVDITSAEIPTMHALLEHKDPARVANAAQGVEVGAIEEIAGHSTERPDPSTVYFLAPSDFQPIKACGVTFASSMLERVFDESYSLDDVRKAELTLRVEGEDGFVLDGRSSMSEISRDPADLVAQTRGSHHQYPDGFFLMLGTLFAPTQDRDAPGEGFTHKMGDVVTIANEQLGALTNTVRLSTECPPWTFGTTALMKNLAVRGLL